MRPDITFAVSSAACYAHSPRLSHEKALICIGQYLKGTKQYGLVLRPTENLVIKCYVGANFAGLWNFEDPADPASVKSRTGFVLLIANCPVLWKSLSQKSISCSTMEAEYHALSTAMRHLLPLRELFKTVAGALALPGDEPVKFRTTVWEDNNGALTLARMGTGRSTPASKFYAIKVHWFQSHLKPNNVEVHKVNTLVQLANIATKGLKKAPFERLEYLLCRWKTGSIDLSNERIQELREFQGE